jgi:hypothetical protein
LAIKAQAQDRENLIGKKKYVCLKHFRVVGQKNDYCHNFFKLYKTLPQDAILNLNKVDTLLLDRQPSTSADTNFDVSSAFESEVSETETIEVYVHTLDVEMTYIVSQGDFLVEKQQREELEIQKQHTHNPATSNLIGFFLKI